MVLLDCDPGIDDALAVAYALGSPELDLIGITTVAGNVGLDKTTANALRLREFLRVPHLPVTAGSAAPLARAAIDAGHVHGQDGLGGARLPAPATQPAPGHAADFIVRTVLAAPGEVTLVATGPLTNIALALRQEPALAASVREFVIMGGSASRGNVTPAAEFNIAADPEAAAEVFAAGWTVIMVGLDATLQARADAAVQARLGQHGRLASELLLPCLRGYHDGDESAEPHWPAVHDMCAVAYVARPELLGLRAARVEVETQGRWTAGMTVTDFRAPAERRNALVAMTIDARAFWDSAHDAFGRAAAAMAVPDGLISRAVRA
jgi:purine nucleosidase